jgi:hypothetical protein
MKKTWHFIAKILLFCYLFIIAYGTIRTGIDKLIEKQIKKKEKILSELISTKEGREKLVKSMTEGAK